VQSKNIFNYKFFIIKKFIKKFYQKIFQKIEKKILKNNQLKKIIFCKKHKKRALHKKI
jgi:hypothetical protein